jgi:hypothetical protein
LINAINIPFFHLAAIVVAQRCFKPKIVTDIKLDIVNTIYSISRHTFTKNNEILVQAECVQCPWVFQADRVTFLQEVVVLGQNSSIPHPKTFGNPLPLQFKNIGGQSIVFQGFQKIL